MVLLAEMLKFQCTDSILGMGSFSNLNNAAVLIPGIKF